MTSVSDDRGVILEEPTPCIIDSEDTRDVIMSDCDSVTEDEDINESSCTDENNNHEVKTTICLVLNRTITQNQCGAIEMTRDSQILYSKDVIPKDIDFVTIATQILQEVPEHITMNMHM